MKALHTILLAGFLVPSVCAQADRKEEIRKKVDEMRESMRREVREGKISRFNVFVTVRLKNGNRLKGVVKNGRFVELDTGIDFVAAGDRHDANAGLRVWYTQNTNSYIFLRYDDILHYKIGQKLSDDQVKAIEAKIVESKRETEENYRRIAEAKKAEDEQRRLDGQQPTGEQPGGDTTETPSKPLTEAQEKLLAEFPPEQGWGEAKLEKLKRERITIGRFPNEQELKFEKSFPDWKSAYEARQAIDAEKSGGARKTPTGSSATPPAPKPPSQTPPAPQPGINPPTPGGVGR